MVLMMDERECDNDDDAYCGRRELINVDYTISMIHKWDCDVLFLLKGRMFFRISNQSLVVVGKREADRIGFQIRDCPSEFTKEKKRKLFHREEERAYQSSWRRKEKAKMENSLSRISYLVV